MFYKHKDTIIKLSLVVMVLLVFRFLSLLLVPGMLVGPDYTVTYVIINILLVIIVLQIYSFFKDYRRKAAIKENKIKIDRMELAMEHLKDVMFKRLNMSKKEIEEYEREEAELESIANSHPR